MMRVIIILIILLTITILGFLVAEIFILKQENDANNFNNTEQLANINKEQTNVNNEQEDNIQTNANELNTEETQVIIPIINENSEQTTQENNTTSLISSTYYYNQLNANSKIIYDNLKENKDKLITGNYEFDFDTQFNTLLHSPNGEQELNEAFQSAWNAFSYDELDLFYIDIRKMVLLREEHTIGGITTYYVSIGKGDNANYLKDEFQTVQQISEAQKYLESIVTQIVEQTAQNTDAEKAKRIHDWLISIIQYDDSETNENKFHIYGALYNKKAVCEGYARSFRYLMEMVGVPCVLVSGTATNSQGQTETHAWNYVQINNQWYAVDVTWDDPVVIGGGAVSEDAKYSYFLKGSENFMKDHTEDGMISENSMEFKYPVLAVNDYE